MSDDGDQGVTELPPIWQFIHPAHDEDGSDDEEGSDEDTPQPAESRYTLDYVKLAKRAPKLGRLLRFLNDIEDDEELQQTVLERDPVTQYSLLQWASLNGHFMLAEYLVKRLRRSAFAFDPDWEDVTVFNRWEEMRPELPSAAEVAERQKAREQERAQKLALRASNPEDDDEDYDDDDDGEEPEPMPEELVYESLDEFHEQWGDRGLGIVKRIGELGVFHGTRLRDGTKAGLGQSLFPNGDCYTGEYKNNQREGKGIYWWSQSTTMYSGEWLRNTRHGYGRIVYPDGSRYLGHWRDDKKSGQGTYTYADGSRYTGDWEANEKHGHGRYDFTDGSSYVGSFFHNDFVSGEWWLACGTVRYVGNFVADRPDGAGVFVHRCGLRQGAFQQEGFYRDGQWFPGTLKGSAKLSARMEVVAPGQKNARVPVEFAARSAASYGLADLVRAVNFAPLQAWLRRLADFPVTLSRIEVVAVRYADETDGAGSPHRVVQLRMRPHLANPDGTRHRPAEEEEPFAAAAAAAEAAAAGAGEDEDDVITLREPSSRILALLYADSGSEVAVVEAVEGGKYRLPAIRVTADGAMGGKFCDVAAPALRLTVGATTVCPLALPAPKPSIRGAPAEPVLLYARRIHPEALAAVGGRLSAAAAPAAGTSYTAVPLADLAAAPADATTAAAATAAVQRRADNTLPMSTVAPQRPPTPTPPPIEPRPELQPLYEAKAARDAATAEE